MSPRTLAPASAAFLAFAAAWSICLAGSVPAVQAAWSPPVTVSSPHELVGGPNGDIALAGAPGGQLAGAGSSTLLVWTAQDGIGAHMRMGVREAVAKPGQGFGRERALPARYATGPLVSIGGGRVAQLILTQRRPNLSAMSVAVGRVDGTFAAPLAVPGLAFGARVSVAGNLHGDLLVSWIAADTHGQRASVWASVRIAGHRFGPAKRISAGAVAPERSWAAIGRDERMVVAFDDGHGHLLARLRDARRGWQPAAVLGPAATGTENDVTPFVSDTGEAIVAWYHTQLCEGGCESPGYTEVAVAPTSLRRFLPAQRLERDPIGAAGAPSGHVLAPVVVAVPWMTPRIVFLAAAGAPRAGSSSRSTVVRVSYPTGAGYGPRGGGYSAPQTLSPPNEQAAYIAAAAGPSGEIVTWIRADPPGFFDGTVFAAVTPFTLPTGRFGAPEQVSPSEHVSSARVVFNSASHWSRNAIPPWIVAWTSRPGGEGPGVNVQTLVRVSSPICAVANLLAPLPSPPAQPDPACTGAE